MSLSSALFRGTVRHRRHLPVTHSFSYRHALVYLDLDELHQVFTGRWLWSVERANLVSFRRADFLGDPEQPLKQAVYDEVQSATGMRPTGRVRLLTTLRQFGHSFNPVSFYFCFDQHEQVVAIVSQITNTPWGERHAYVHDARGQSLDQPLSFAFSKCFHVSPFMDMQMDYEWRFVHQENSILVHMNVLQNGARHFDATLSLQRQRLTAWNMARMLMRFPLTSLQVLTAINWQALRLWLKKAPVYDHDKAHAGTINRNPS